MAERAAVSLTFDVDGETGLACRPGDGWEQRLTSLARRASGSCAGCRGSSMRWQATTCGPPSTCRARSRSAIRRRSARSPPPGTRSATTGHAHLPSHRLDARAQRQELERGLAALEDCTGARPCGYRSPAWELTPTTLDLLGELGFTHDSSLMGDDRPYRLPGGLLELPVHWSLDDVPYLAFDPDAPARLGDPAALLARWIAEYDAPAEHAS